LDIIDKSSDYSCCGFGGLFSLNRSDLALAIGSNYLQVVLQSGATAMVSSDLACLLHLQGILTNTNLPMYHLVELLSQAIQGR